MVSATGLRLKAHGRGRTLKGLPVTAEPRWLRARHMECVPRPHRPFKVRLLPWSFKARPHGAIAERIP